jgi:hypothetical protein
MTPEQLEAIRENVLSAQKRQSANVIEHDGLWDDEYRVLENDAPALLAVVECLQTENAQMQSLVGQLATMPDMPQGCDGSPADCPWCERSAHSGSAQIAHRPECPVAKARTLMVERQPGCEQHVDARTSG